MKSLWAELKALNRPILALAPLDGVTDVVFREIIAEIAKPDVFYTEFTSVEALCSQGFDKTIPRFSYTEKQLPVIAQIWGTHPENFYTVAVMIRELGLSGVDINMGCPDRSVMKIGSGASLIKDITLSKEIIKATKEGAKDLSISVKTRIGMNTPVTEEWASFLLEQRLDALTIHGRTARELSKVPAHWDEIAKVVKLRDHIAPETIIIGNGDISSIQEADEAQRNYSVDGVMIGRGVFSNPWVFERIPVDHPHTEYLQLLMHHAARYRETHGESHSYNTFKKFIKMYVKSFRNSHKLKDQLMKSTDYSELEKLIQPYFGGV